MDSYCQYNNAFYNNDNENLDKLARQVNNSKKSLQKRIKEEIDQQEKNTCIGIDCLLDSSNSRYAPSNLSDFSFFSTQGDFSSQLPTPLSKNKKKRHNDTESQFTDANSLDSFINSTNSFESNSSLEPLSKNYSEDRNWRKPYYDCDSDISSNYSSLSPKIKKHLRLNTNHLNNYKESDEKNILNHIKKCDQCKNQLVSLLKSENHIFSGNEIIKSDVSNNGILSLPSSELKDMLILILIGIFIIIFADIFIGR